MYATKHKQILTEKHLVLWLHDCVTSRELYVSQLINVVIQILMSGKHYHETVLLIEQMNKN